MITRYSSHCKCWPILINHTGNGWYWGNDMPTPTPSSPSKREKLLVSKGWLKVAENLSAITASAHRSWMWLLKNSRDYRWGKGRKEWKSMNFISTRPSLQDTTCARISKTYFWCHLFPLNWTGILRTLPVYILDVQVWFFAPLSAPVFISHTILIIFLSRGVYFQYLLLNKNYESFGTSVLSPCVHAKALSIHISNKTEVVGEMPRYYFCFSKALWFFFRKKLISLPHSIFSEPLIIRLS